MVWGIGIIWYLFLAGAGAGLFISTWTLSNLGGRHRNKPFVYALSTALVAAAASCLALDAEAGMLDPIRFLALLNNPHSALAWGTMILGCFIVMSGLSAFFAFRERFVPPTLELAGVLFAFGVALYSGFLLGSLGPFPLWNIVGLPLLFLASSLSSGSALGNLIRNWGLEREDEPFRLGGWVFFLAEAAFVTLLAVNAANHGQGGIDSCMNLLLGSCAPVFWVGFALPGLLTQIATLIPAHSQNGANAKRIVQAILACTSSFCLRYCIVMAAVPQTLTAAAVVL